MAVALLSGNCTPKAGFVEQARTLPDEPRYVVPVHVAPERPDDSCIVKHQEEKQGRLESNRRLVAFRAWYRQTKANYSAKP